MTAKDIPSPQECGLPNKFGDWRRAQADGLEFLLSSQKRVKVLCSPTGSGKTGLAVAYALLTPQEPTCIVTENRGLQDQYNKEFKEIGLVDVRGRNNYTCPMRDEFTCEDGYAARCPYKGTVQCDSSRAEMAAAASSLVVTNYAKWTAARKFGHGMAHFKRVIFDEGHEAPNALARAIKVVLHEKVQEDIGLDFPAQDDSMEAWKSWAITARADAEQLMLQWQRKVEAEPKPTWVKMYIRLKHLTKKLAVLATCRATDWIVEAQGKEFHFDPIRPGRYAEAAMLLKIPSIVVMSATIRPKTMYMLGVGKENFDFKEFDSEFDPRDCPIYHVDTMRVDSRADSLAQVWLKFDQIAARRQDRKGICQTISFARRDEITAASRFSGNFIINEKGEAPTEMVDEFRAAGPGTIFVSPSVASGYDFPGPDCEWQFICKVPFPPPSKILKARTHDDPELPYYIAMNKLVQICGRGARFKGDRCENFIPDNHLHEWFLGRYGHLAPRSFHMFYRSVSILPPPPPKL